MTHKQECLCYCIDHLESRSLSFVFKLEIFTEFFNKNNTPVSNPYNIGINAADEMIQKFKPELENVTAE